MHGRISYLVVRLEKFVDRAWYPFLVALLAAIDLFVAVIPTDGILVTSSLLRPKRWVAMFVSGALGSAVGAAVLSILVNAYGEPFVEWISAGALQSETWVRVADLLNQYGAPALALMAFGPLPQQPAVVLCALAHMPILVIVFAVLAGRGVKYAFFCWAASHAPRLLERFRVAHKETAAITSAAAEKQEATKTVTELKIKK
jgi:membrane protein YqaA with SNARE-associated domain